MKISDDQNLTFRSVNNRLLRLAKSRTGRGAWGGGVEQVDRGEDRGRNEQGDRRGRSRKVEMNRLRDQR